MMPSVSATVTIPVAVELVYRYLRERYDGEVHRGMSRATKGYVPDIACLEAAENRRLAFHTEARDPFLPIAFGGWRWQYDLYAVSESVTEVTIRYEWSWIMSALSAWTIRHQACNELIETAMALDALRWGQTAAYPATWTRPELPPSEAIRPMREQS